MSRMTRFLKQSCLLEKYVVENGQPKANMYGELQYQNPIRVSCRREGALRDIQTTNGSIIRATSVYYLDNSEVIKPNYRIDGHVVAFVIDYVNGMGQIEGYEVYV